MFAASLVLVGIQLFAAVAIYVVVEKKFAAALAIGLAGVAFTTIAVPSAIRIFSAAAFFQVVALCVLALACAALKVREPGFLIGGVAATALVVACIGSWDRGAWTKLEQRYPFQSLSRRLAYETKAAESTDVRAPRAGILAVNLSPETLTRLDEEEHYWKWNWAMRGESLRLVHASFVEQFIASPGFGVGRMPRPSPYSIELSENRGAQALPLDRRPDMDGSVVIEAPPAAAEEFSAVPPDLAYPLGAFHDAARRDFLDPDAFGYILDRDSVAGFVPHTFSKDAPKLYAPESHRRWLTVRVELVSMLKHDRPMVYISDRLPNMAELRDAPVRELDAFERQALEGLLQGEDLVTDVQPDRARAVGSLRAMRRCLECHEVERGALLGAFSYEFLRDPPPPRSQDAGEGNRISILEHEAGSLSVIAVWRTDKAVD